MTQNYDEQVPTNLLAAWSNHKRQAGGVLHFNKETLVHNTTLIITSVDIFCSLKSWAQLALDDKYWKNLLNGLGNAPTSPPGPPPAPTAEILQPPYPPSTSRPI